MAIDEKFKVFINSLHGKARNFILQALTVVTAYSVTPFAIVPALPIAGSCGDRCRFFISITNRLGPGWVFKVPAGMRVSQVVPCPVMPFFCH